MIGPRKFRLRRRVLWAVALLSSLASLGLSLWLVGSPPPRTIVLGTGDPHGGFAALGDSYKQRLERMGLHVELVESHGSIENLRRLQRGELDVAFVQAGVVQALDGTDNLRGLAAIGSHPLWIFSAAKTPITSLRELAGHKVSLGPRDSGTAALARLLLQEYGVTTANTTFLNFSMGETSQALRAGQADYAFLVCSCEAPVIHELLTEQQARLDNLGQHQAAIAHRFRYLRPVKLPRGVLDLEHDLPAEEIPLLAPRILLVARDDLHPRAIEQVLKVAQTIHSAGNRLDEQGQFPTIDGMDLPPHLAAEKFLKSGESLAARLLPYWGVRLFWQIQLLVLPILALLLPFWRTLPLLYTYRINRILKQHYQALRDLESRIDHCNDLVELRKLLDALGALRTDMQGLSRKLPAHLQRDVYHWRLHVAVVQTEGRERLQRLERRSAGDRGG